MNYFLDQWRTTWDGWNRFWFTPSDPATLGLIRVCAGLMLFYTHLVWVVNHNAFFGPNAWLSIEGRASFVAKVGADDPFTWSHLLWISSPAILWLLHITALVVLALLALGLFSRITSILAFLITVSYANRAIGTTFGLDTINVVLAMYLMVGPCGAAYSLDNVLRRRRGMDSPPTASIAANIAIRLLQVHMCVIYFFSGAGKLLGVSWWDGTAMWTALGNYEYQSIDMTWLAHWPLALDFLTHFTVVWEITYWALVWPRRTRPLIIALAIPIHMGIAACMGMITFGLAMLIGNMAFVSPWLVRAIVQRPFLQLKSELPTA